MNANLSPVGSDNKHAKEALRLWLRLLACKSMLAQHVRSKLREEFGITLPQFDVLAELDYVGKPLTMTELSNQLMVSNGNITGVVGRLVRDDYVERLLSPTDRRIQLITLSEKGKKAFKQMALQHEQWIAQAFDELTVDEIQQITEQLTQAGDKLKAKFGKSTR
ncbi:MAG: DNA-binding MarR family transcriptional regulator [Planctomycetota bacterium]|jgi:DNA-binding MarR family transcriptional regulator